MRQPGNSHSTALMCLAALSWVMPLRSASYDCAALSVPGTPSGINNDGVIVGSANGHGFIRDTGGNVKQIDYPGQTNTQLFAINNHGVITGQWGNILEVPGTFGFFTVDLSGNFQDISFPPPYNAPVLFIRGINDDGAILAATLPAGSLFATALVLRPDGSISAFPTSGIDAVPGFLGALNNSYNFLVSADHSTSGITQLFAPDGTSTPIIWNATGGYGPTAATALNNSGVIAGSIGTYSKAPPWNPYTGFVRDASGNFSGLGCPASPTAINDAGVVVGGDSSGSSGSAFIATPLPGTPQIRFSVYNIVFPPTPGNTPSAPVPFTVTNTGDGRLDLGGPNLVGVLPPFSPPFFQVTSCMIGAATVVSLNPGEQCTVNVTALPLTTFPGVYDDMVFFRDSSSGSPHGIPVTVTVGSAPPPSCQVSQIVTGPPKQLIVAMQDTGSGLASINLEDSVNASVSIPAFASGTTSQVLVTATKVDQTQSSDVAFLVTNIAGFTTSCDPVDFTATLDGLTERHVFRSVNPAEHYIQIKNGTPGVRQMTFFVKGHAFPVPALQDGETYTLDIGSAMLATTPDSTAEPKIAGRPVPRRSPGQAANNVVMYASGQRGSSAYILIGDSSVLGGSAR